MSAPTIWQPIDTAPKDGEIYEFKCRRHIETGRWVKGRIAGEGWANESGYWFQFTPTHWRQRAALQTSGGEFATRAEAENALRISEELRAILGDALRKHLP